MKKAPKFPFEHNDVVMFPDTESTYVDVGFGENYKVAEVETKTLAIVCKKGRGYRLKLRDYSEMFMKRENKYISTKEYLDMFGNYDELEYCCEKEDLDMDADLLEQKYNI